MTKEILEIQAYVDRMELLVGICVVLFVVGAVGIFWMLFHTKGDDDE